MQATNPITEHGIVVSRQHARRPHGAAPRVPVPGAGHPAANENVRPASRSQVLDAFRDLAHGIAAPDAEQQMRDFYRSSGQAWTQSLAEQGGEELRTRVVEAFRALAHGAPHGPAHASMLQFYRSSGQRWAQRLA